MPDVSAVPGWAWPTGIGFLVIAIKYFWPLMRQSIDTQVAQGRTESGLLNQLMVERNKALERADAADKRADELFSQLADVRTQLQLMTYQLKTANDQIAALTATVNELRTMGHD